MITYTTNWWAYEYQKYEALTIMPSETSTDVTIVTNQWIFSKISIYAYLKESK
jgi:hypothetical protein